MAHRDINCKAMYSKVWYYSGLSLSRTRKGPENLFEIEKVRDREKIAKN